MKISQALINAAQKDNQKTVKDMISRMNMQDVFMLMQISHTLYKACMHQSDSPIIGDMVKVLDDGSDYKNQIGKVIMEVMTPDKYVVVVEFSDKTQQQFYPAQLTLKTKAQHIRK